MEVLSIYGVALVPVIMGIIELLKRTGVPKQYSPIIALILGIFSGFYYLAPGDPPKAVFFGIIAGLSAVGLYSGTKNTFQGFSSTNSGLQNKSKLSKKIGKNRGVKDNKKSGANKKITR